MAPTSHLPKLPGATLDDADISFNPATYTSKDTRRVQRLAPVVTVEELRKTGVLGVRHNITSSLAYPGLTAKSLQEPPDAGAGAGGDADDGASDAPSAASGAARGSPAAKGSARMASPDQYDATAAARSTLLHERPNVVERMEKGVAVCGVLRDNRHYRLNSLGVFHAGVNDVRTRSMHRVELHKHLSSTNLRAPQGDKEVRSAVQQDNVGTRLEKMYNRVLKSQYLTDDPGSVTWGVPAGSGGGAGGARGGGGGGGGLSQVASGMAASGLAGSPSGTLGNGAGGGGSPSSLRKAPGGAGGGGGGAPGGAGNSQRRLGGPGGMSISIQDDGRAGPGPGSEALRGKAQGSFLLTPSHATARSGGGGGGAMNSPTHAARSGGGAGLGSSPSMLIRHGSPGAGGAGSPGPGLGSSQQLPNPFAAGPGGGGGVGSTASPNSQQQLGGTGKGTARSADYWVKVTLPPEVIEAQLRHLAATTEANLRAYHARVAAAQDELLYSSGLGPETLGLNPEQVEQSLKIKLGQIQEVTTANDFNYSSLSREAVLASRLGAASKQLLTATSLPQFIRAALEHVTQHTSELQQLAEPDRAKAEHGKPHRRRLGKAAPVGLGTGNADGSSPGAVASAAAADGDSDGDDPSTRRSSGSELWPEYGSVRQRAAEFGWAAPEHRASMALGTDSPHRASEAGVPGAGGAEGGEGGAGERWRPPAPAKAPAGSPAPAAPGERKMGRTITIMRKPDAMITEEWMEEFRDHLLEIEGGPVAPHCPPDGIQPLPPLGAGDMDAGAYVRSRLERLWGVLGMPPHTRLDMVLFFTSRDRALTFAGSLELWEAAAAAVLSREAQVEALVAVQHEIESDNADRLSLGALSALCVRVLQQTRWVAALSERLRQDNGWELTFNGQPYPGPDAISSTHLVAFMEMLRQATEVTGLRP
ncbi:hypothetical protein HXX76_002814 [Chlamydomonas incerta]|uniref:Uncharacterized protein n=1 Tax=Chlamydomonas incerta TaxID=51695 RepID=A0A835TC36_CHLIN|nr:hypothetical protein HXX76_002814 [Chlamydomonas incerta]|eukprot:KAG2442732.1 hypothetical protein HXX76_002814 [Chlamydomonas incerta]